MTTPPPEPAPAAPVDERVTRIELEQDRQGTVLDRIVSILGDDTSSDTTVTRADNPVASVADMGEQMRQAVRDVRAEEAAASTTQDKTPPPETTPREVMIRGKERLQRALFGGDPKK